MSAKKLAVNPGGKPIIQELENVRLVVEQVQRLMNPRPGASTLGVFGGPSGYGKTSAATHAAILFGAVHIECGFTWNQTALVDNIYYELTATTMKGTIYDKTQAIIGILASDRRPLLVDEADYLVKKSTIDILREMSDKSGTGVLLIGEEHLGRKLKAFPRTHNRISDWGYAQPCDVESAVALAAMLAPGITIEPALIEALVDSTRGVTRIICNNIAAIDEFAALRGLDRVGPRDWAIDKFYTGDTPERTRKPGRVG